MARRFALSGAIVEGDLEIAAEADADASERSLVRYRVEHERRASPAAWSFHHYFHGSDEPYLSMLRGADEYWLRAHGHADFFVRARGEEVVASPFEGCARLTLEQLFLDAVLPQVLSLRGVLALHASSVEIADDVAVGFLGPAGAGKSTIAAAFAARGAAVLSDDCLALDQRDLRARVAPGYASVRLFEDSVASLDLHTDLSRATPRNTKLRARFRSATKPPELRTLYVLARGAAHVAVEPMRARDGLLEAMRFVHRIDPDDRALLERELSLLDHLARVVSVKRLSYPTSFEAIGAVRAMIEADALSSAR